MSPLSDADLVRLEKLLGLCFRSLYRRHRIRQPA